MSTTGASKIYTKGGDKGKTSLIGGTRVSKAERRLHAYGTVDELNSVLGMLIADIATDFSESSDVRQKLERELFLIQRELFNVGSRLACEDEKIRDSLPTVSSEEIAALETSMDAFSAKLKPLRHFVLPGGARSAATAHLARTVCRRAERLTVKLNEKSSNETDLLIVQYMNRLSDYLFVLARHLNRLLGRDEPIWEGKSKK